MAGSTTGSQQGTMGPRGFLLDLDATLISGGRVLPGVLGALAALGDRFAIVSNNAEHTPALLAARLADMGFAVPADRLILAGAVAVELVARERPGSKLMLLAPEALREHARALGLGLVSRAPDTVLVGRDVDFSYSRLTAAAAAVAEGADFILAAPDLAHRGAAGFPVPEPGSLAAAISACAGVPPLRIVGKPEPLLFRLGLQRLGLPARDVLMIGDNTETDGRGAAAAGILFLQVRPDRPFNTDLLASELA
jgi:HAD superfamily hydrolase (TIGR01450 family)